mmetsp:Transcript_15128/g.43703  ORF Transcript_15128/g.43703 Transcript_15128/m.43703 type:complete len:419 (-) Transcript_15128:193-1449(-)
MEYDALQGEPLAADVDPDDDDGISEDIAVIIDNGSGVCKAGLSSDTFPRVVFPSVVGMPRQAYRDVLDRDIYFGDDVLPFGDMASPEVIDRCGKLSVHYPLENGIIENFEHMERLWEYAFLDKLNVNPQRHPVLLTEPPYNPKPNREKMVEIMFEAFEVPMLNISIQGVLALFEAGRMTGLVLDSGEGVTHTLPIFQGFGLPHCINRMDIAGRELNTLLAKLMAAASAQGSDRGMCLTKTTEQQHVRRMKEQFCYVASDPAKEFPEPATYRLPDGREVTLTDERWQTPEALFDPSLVGFETGTLGVAGMVWNSITRCDIDVRRTLLNNVVLSGGSTLFPGFTDRLTDELRRFAPPASQGNVRVVQRKHEHGDQRFAVWRGAQVFAGLRTMSEDQWISREEYDEFGVQLVHDRLAVKYS